MRKSRWYARDCLITQRSLRGALATKQSLTRFEIASRSLSWVRFFSRSRLPKNSRLPSPGGQVFGEQVTPSEWQEVKGSPWQFELLNTLLFADRQLYDKGGSFATYTAMLCNIANGHQMSLFVFWVTVIASVVARGTNNVLRWMYEMCLYQYHFS